MPPRLSFLSAALLLGGAGWAAAGPVVLPGRSGGVSGKGFFGSVSVAEARALQGLVGGLDAVPGVPSSLLSALKDLDVTVEGQRALLAPLNRSLSVLQAKGWSGEVLIPQALRLIEHELTASILSADDPEADPAGSLSELEQLQGFVAFFAPERARELATALERARSRRVEESVRRTASALGGTKDAVGVPGGDLTLAKALSRSASRLGARGGLFETKPSEAVGAALKKHGAGLAAADFLDLFEDFVATAKARMTSLDEEFIGSVNAFKSFSRRYAFHSDEAQLRIMGPLRWFEARFADQLESDVNLSLYYFQSLLDGSWGDPRGRPLHENTVPKLYLRRLSLLSEPGSVVGASHSGLDPSRRERMLAQAREIGESLERRGFFTPSPARRLRALLRQWGGRMSAADFLELFGAVTLPASKTRGNDVSELLDVLAELRGFSQNFSFHAEERSVLIVSRIDRISLMKKDDRLDWALAFHRKSLWGNGLAAGHESLLTSKTLDREAFSGAARAYLKKKFDAARAGLGGEVRLSGEEAFLRELVDRHFLGAKEIRLSEARLKHMLDSEVGIPVAAEMLRLLQEDGDALTPDLDLAKASGHLLRSLSLELALPLQSQ